MPKNKIDPGVRRQFVEQARSPRTTVRLVSPVRGQEGAKSDLEILNISTTGMLFRHKAARDGWTAVEVLLPNGKCVAGSVSWTDEDLVGFKFDAALSKADVAAVVLKSEPLASPASPAPQPRPPERTGKDILRNLPELRAAAGMSISELADKLGVSRQAVWYWEQGRSAPRTGAMHALLDLFGGARHQISAKTVSPSTEFADEIARKKAELAEYLGIEESAIRIIVEQ